MSLNQVKFALTSLYGVDTSEMSAFELADCLERPPARRSCDSIEDDEADLSDFDRLLVAHARKLLAPHIATRH